MLLKVKIFYDKINIGYIYNCYNITLNSQLLTISTSIYFQSEANPPTGVPVQWD